MVRAATDPHTRCMGIPGKISAVLLLAIMPACTAATQHHDSALSRPIRAAVVAPAVPAVAAGRLEHATELARFVVSGHRAGAAQTTPVVAAAIAASAGLAASTKKA